MKNIIVAPVGDNINDLYIAMREFPAERVVLISTKDQLKAARKVQHNLDRFKIKVEVKNIQGNIWEEMFRAVSEIQSLYKDKSIIVHTSTGNRSTTCAATSAAFVNGLKAIAVDDNEAMLLPVLKFSYYKLLTEKKMQILEFIYSKDCCSSMEELSRRMKMSLPLVSYHINGNLKSEGLRDLGLVETEEVKGRTQIALTILGRLLIKGYVH
jgi:DNA-binding transcriptional ArsR family regulator